MTTTELELLLELLEMNRPLGDAPLQARREQYDRAAVAFAGPAGAEEGPVVAAGGEWSRPACPGDPVLLYLHGGSYTMGSSASHRHLARAIGAAAGAAVFTVDYRRAPEAPFPAAVEDALAAFERLTGLGIPAGRIVLAGDSAGAGLALALLQRLRDQGAGMPAAVACLSPWTDLSCSSSTHRTHGARDPVLRSADLRLMAGRYLGAASAGNPWASPVLADLTGLPPLLIQVGTEEILLDDARSLAERARACGVNTRYEEWPGMFHVWQYYFPLLSEGRAAVRGIGEFLGAALRASRPSAGTGSGAG